MRLEPESLEIKSLYDSAQPFPIGTAMNGAIEHAWEKYYTLKPGDVFVEAGPFWGRYAFPAQNQGCSKIILIEPSPVNVATIQNLINAKLLDKDKIILVLRAISDKKQTVTFYNRGNSAGHGLIPPETRGLTVSADDKNEILIEADNLDNILDKLGIDHVDLLASDCEDAEINLIKGAAKYLNEKRILNVAIATYHAAGNHEAVTSMLEERGFKGLKCEDGVTYGHL